MEASSSRGTPKHLSTPKVDTTADEELPPAKKPRGEGGPVEGRTIPLLQEQRESIEERPEEMDLVEELQQVLQKAQVVQDAVIAAYYEAITSNLLDLHGKFVAMLKDLQTLLTKAQDVKKARVLASNIQPLVSTLHVLRQNVTTLIESNVFPYSITLKEQYETVGQQLNLIAGLNTA